MNKQKSHAFGKDVYLLGKNKQGEYLWLEAAKWDCDWYWGFGYVETYTKTAHPEQSKDINSHSHFGSLLGKQEYYDLDKGCFRTSTDYIYHLNMNPDIKETVLTESEAWELSDLMKSYYTLKATAEIYHSGNSHYTTTHNVNLKNKDQEDYINKVLMPQIFNRVYEILSPA